jgi:starch synthase
MILKVLIVTACQTPLLLSDEACRSIFGLAVALKKKNVDVRMVMPRTSDIPGAIQQQIHWHDSILVPVGWDKRFCGLEQVMHQHVPVYFLDNKEYFLKTDRDFLEKNAEAYAFFNRGALEMLPYFDFRPDVIHSIDWYTGMVPALHKIMYQQIPFYQHMKTVFTIRQMNDKGCFPRKVLREWFNLGSEHLTQEGLEFYGDMCFLKAGINYADYLTTLSPSYASDIQHPAHGAGLEGLMQWQSKKLAGLVHGPDTDVYSPADNRLLSAPYTADTIEKKAENKRWLQEKLGLPVRNVPLLALPGPLTDERGVNLVLEVLDELIDRDLQLVVLGSGDSAFEEVFKRAAGEHPEKCVLQQPQSIDREHQLFAASDFFLATPVYEPRGMNGLEAVYFGSIPIVRFAGGYRDTMIDFRDPSGNGFAVTFTGDHRDDLMDAIHTALRLYEKEPNRTLEIAQKAMSQPYGWDQTADTYVNLYRTLLNRSG